MVPVTSVLCELNIQIAQSPFSDDKVVLINRSKFTGLVGEIALAPDYDSPAYSLTTLHAANH